ncbi:hypothetical protein R6Q59_012750 [Mikania micrantha]
MFEPTTSTSVNGGHTSINHKPPTSTRFRLLCHASLLAGVIGNSGDFIKQLQHDTVSSIRVEAPIAGSEDRVITVIASSLVNRTLSFNKDNSYHEVSEVSAAQEALIRVFERILVVAAEADGGYLASGGVVSCRLLVDKSIIGSVIGKRGKVIEKIRKDTGCKIRILVQDELPSCALPTDEMIKIEGDILATKKALVAVTCCLRDRLYADKTNMNVGRPHQAVPRETINDRHINVPFVSSDVDTSPSIDSRACQQEIVFRMLCSSDRVGSVIGKSGTIVQALQKESGAKISFGSPVSDCDERLITITAMETLESRNSPTQNAVILVFNRSEARPPSSTGLMASARLLISPNQRGCLLGKGGSIIADMRKVTGAVIKIVGVDQVPKCALDTDLVVLITGQFVNVRDALYSVTGRLRNNFFSSKMSMDHGTRGNANLTRSMEGLKFSSRRPTPAKPHSRIGVKAGKGRNVDMGSTSVGGGTEFGSGGRSAIVTGMSVDIVVPQNIIGRVYGENESNLTRLRQISGAKVVVHEPQSGTTDYIVVISGTPDQTQSAQSLLQAFILTDHS